MNTHPDLYFGALAVKNGYASPSEIELALEAQKEGPAFERDAPPKLGEILAEMGTLTPTQVQTLLDTQTKLRKDDDPTPAPQPVISDATVKFEEIAGAALIQEAGPALRVNEEPLTAPRTLKAGDRLQAGDLVFRFSGEAIEICPRETPAAPGAEKPAEPTAPRPSIASKVLPLLRAVDGVVARIIPSVHPQRKYVLAAALLGAIAFILPWRIASNGNSVLGIQGAGWLPFLLTLVPVALTLLTRPGEPFTKPERIASSAASGLALLILLALFLFPPSYAKARGAGLYLSILSGAALVAAGAFARAGGSAASSDVPTLGARLWKKLSGLLGSVSGRRARELNAAIELRDALLRKIGEAALDEHAGLPEGEAALQAQVALEKAEKDAGDPAAANVRAKAAQKAAEAKAKRAFAKLAQRALDQGLPLAGQDAAIAELRAVEARIKDLSA
jgi:hypothetical protein